ncbi:hypothetical protein HYY70_04145 [Candidatus Woesearchaeota archaeon]|nr:hypothetical protein [Candidatus Woesearchaeota archaeon]
MTQVTDSNPTNPEMSDQEVMRYINRHLREARIGVKERYASYLGVGNNPSVGMETRRSKTRIGNYITIIIDTIPPTEEELKSVDLNRKRLRSLLPSTLMRNEFEVAVYAPQPEDEIGALVLKTTLVGGLVTDVGTPAVSPYHERLVIGDPLEKVLSVTFEAYRTKYVPLATTSPTGF